MKNNIKKNKIAVIGANGFIGQALSTELIKRKYNVNSIVRKKNYTNGNLCKKIDNIDKNTNWNNALENVKTIIYCAGIAHNKFKNKKKIKSAYEDISTHGVKNLVAQAAFLGIDKFIFISSIGVNGKDSFYPLTENSAYNPNDMYSDYKIKTELLLLDLSKIYEMEFLIVRPPLVYSKNAPGNFNNLIKLIETGLPLPFKSIKNKRSFVALDNIVDFIILISSSAKLKKSRYEIFLISDDEFFSTPYFIYKIAEKIKKKVILFPVPVFFVKLILFMCFKSRLIPSIFNSLIIDNSKAKKQFGWKPITNLDKQLNKISI